jgi:hypothetical protein
MGRKPPWISRRETDLGIEEFRDLGIGSSIFILIFLFHFLSSLDLRTGSREGESPDEPSMQHPSRDREVAVLSPKIKRKIKRKRKIQDQETSIRRRGRAFCADCKS